MDKSQRTVDSLKLLQDWSKWLITLQTAVCMSLWPKLTGTPAPSGVMYAGWMMFWASIIVAVMLLLCIPCSCPVSRNRANATSGKSGHW